MNISELGQGQVRWWIPVAVSVPATIVIGGLIYLGKRLWRGYRQRVLNKGWKSRYAFATHV